ncbi:lysine-specific demethylase JMJ17 isoform X2 [Salvia miltiorrhiza]|uniref:lysine-specific demethylase JMJ17 isoform X2 n=1 Tax=Salvia miltiorrhiza TaxID=226208 RepID=UPI0025AC69B6|nr:lysine-specific demethylase JMJ17 isoform X2 [Salvia miltiorrhiza]
MGGRTRKVEKGVLGGGSGGLLGGSDCESLNVPSGPVFYPSEEEFKDPLKYIYKIRPEAEPYGICKIVPPVSWKPPFALDMESFTFGTKTQAIHQLQARCAPCDPKTFRLEYNRFLEEHCGKKARKRIVFEGQDLDLCKLFNAVKRYGGYDNVAKMKKWGDVFRFIRPGAKISACSKHVLAQLYLEHLIEYEEYFCQLNKGKVKSCKRGINGSKKCELGVETSGIKRRRKNKEGDRVEIHKVEDKELDQICEQCKSGFHGDVMLLCDRCDKGWHTYCLSPPLMTIPPGNWYCLECLNSEKDSFGFVPGKQFSIEAFRRVADRVKKKWFGSAATSWVQVEKKFWEIVEGSAGEVEVMYGSDLDTSAYGSGFPRQIDQRPPSVDIDVWNEYCGSPWNLNNLPRLQGSMLRTVHQNIAGVMVPWLYLGMVFSAFCWHFEDHCFYSMNYHHWGEPKCWYSVPGNETHAFEKVMRDSLPDLFEAQPDLLFQLVTMLNPSVLKEKGVPVYSIIQEPGNFVITFPRSYHGGFNLGLNCAEAVNFAPADWLPHGGFGAELYRQYHRVPVLSHEELLCVVAKSEFDSEVSPYLKEELLRIYNNERTWRERLWRNGIIRSSRMTPRAQPDYVGTEEDPMCIICQQLLYLSAVSCNCRPSTYVCLEHWEHLCECKPNKLRLQYRHTLAELTGLLHEADKFYLVEAADDSHSQRTTSSEKQVVLTKKVKGGHVTHLQLAEEWILKSCKILEHPYSSQAYVSAIEEAEQFLWAGSEMDLVREMHTSLIEARKWAKSVRNCVSKLKMWSNKSDSERIPMNCVNELLKFSTPPCNEPRHIQLKEYKEEADILIQEINSALALWSEFSLDDLEILYTKAVDLPIHIKETEQLNLKLSALKVWVDNVRNCLSQKAPSSVEVDMLYKLQAEILEKQIQLPEADRLNDLIRQVESCRSRCVQILKDLDSLKEIEQFLGEWEDFTVNVPELGLLRKYYSDTISWMSRFDLVLLNVQEREDQGKLVNELTCIQQDALLLKIRVDELPRIELELNKARSRVKAFEVLHGKMSMVFVQQLMSEAILLQIEKEKLFVDISQRHAGAVLWEKKAQELLATKAPMSEFEDILRASEEIGIIPPSLPEVKLAVSTAKQWLSKCKPFLFQGSSSFPVSDSCHQVGKLKELVLESEDLKVHLEERSLLERVLKKAIEWEQEASSLLQDVEDLWLVNIVGEGAANSLKPRLEHHALSIETAVAAGVSLGLKLNMVPKLQDACSMLKWCIHLISFSSLVPTHKEVEMMLEDADNLPGTYKSCALWTSLFDGLQWLRKSIDILDPNNHGQFEVSSVDRHILLAENLYVPFPLVIGRLQDAVQNHNLWLEQVHLFLGLSLGDRSWNSLLQLKEHGTLNAFSCVELQKVLFEFEKVKKWKEQCAELVKHSSGKENSLLNALTKLKEALERSLEVFNYHETGESRYLCLCCASAIEDPDLLTCSVCNDSFHSHCTETLLEDAVLFVCQYCDFVNRAKLPRGGCSALRSGKKPVALDELKVLLSDANDLCLRTEEWKILDQIVVNAHDSIACVMELVNFALSYTNPNLDVVKQKLCFALKAISVSGICDDEADLKFELALARNSWKIRADKLLQSSEKPALQQIQHHLHEGLVMKIPPEDYFTLRLTEMKDMGLQWADTAKQVSVDGGVLGLDRVFALIYEGECLPVSCEKELKLLRDRSMLYCICRRPYGQRAMIACDKCDEWYHFDCVKISLAPKVYICPACNSCPDGDMPPSALTAHDRCSAEEPHTPLRRSELRRNSSKKVAAEVEMNIKQRDFSNFERLLWRQRKPFRRAARKRSQLQTLSPFFYVQDN